MRETRRETAVRLKSLKRETAALRRETAERLQFTGFHITVSQSHAQGLRL
jgi:hypothetical protein